MLQRIRNSKAFTLIELMAVVAILAILVAIALPKYCTYRDKQSLQNDKQIEETLELEKDKDLEDNTL